MKIIYISTAEVPSTRANSLQVMKVCQALIQLSESVQLCLPAGRQVEWQELERVYGLTERFEITRLPSRPFFHRLDLIIASLALARREKADLIYTRISWAALLARLAGFKTVLEMHDLPTGRLGPLVYRTYLRARKPKLTVYITAALKRLIDQKTGVSAGDGQFVIAPDGVDLERYRDLPEPARARKKLGLPDTLTAVYSGGFYEGRGLEILLPLAQAFPQVQFLWVGGNPDQVSTWSARLLNEGVTNVTLPGFINNDQLSLYQAAADVLLMPYSLKFGGSGGGDIARVSSPLKLFEYMASGRAILASDLPVLREVLDDSMAYFYPPGDFSQLCSRFAALLGDPSLRKRLGAKARETVNAFSWQTRMAGIISAVDSLSVKK